MALEALKETRITFNFYDDDVKTIEEFIEKVCEK